MLIPWGTSKILGQKKSKFIIRSKFIVRSKFSRSEVFFSLSIFYWNDNNRFWCAFASFLQFWKSNEFVATFDVIILLSSQLDDLISRRLGMAMQDTWSYTTWFGKCSIHYAYIHIVFKLYDILRLDSTVVINVLINISCLRLNNQIRQMFEAYCMNSFWVYLNT